MEHPSAERLPDTEDKQPELYEKDERAAGIHGHTLQYKYCALVYLRAKNKGYKFKLAPNAKGIGAFDVGVIEYPDGAYRRKHIFLHLQSKVKRHISMSQLKSKDGHFSLRKYYEWYLQIEKNLNCSEEGVKINSSMDGNLFIIHTDADVARDLLSKNLTDIGEEKFLMTGGDVLRFNEEEHKDIYEHLQELPKHREFLSRLRIFYSQADEEEMDSYIKRELQKSMTLPDSELEFTYMCFRDFVNDWWQKGNYFLKENSRKENDPLQKTSDKLRTALVTKILDQRKSELDDLSVKYKQSAITDMKQLIEPHNAVLIFATGRSTTLTAAKIHQMLSDTKHIILNLQQLVCYKTEVLLAWKSSFEVLVLESQSSTENLQEVFNDISIILEECSVERRFIFVAHRMSNIQQIRALRRTFGTNLTEKYDDWKFTDLVNESKTFLLEKKVIFQGTEIRIRNLVKESDFRMLNALDGDSLSRLLGDVKPSIGIPIEETPDYYIDRTLDCIQNVKPGTHKESELLLPFRKDNMEELKGITACTESNCKIIDHTQGIPQLSLVNENEQEPTRVCNETTELQCSKTKDKKHPYKQRNDGLENAHRDLESKSTRVWRPGTLLDGENRIILVVDEPGMGKSTLITHLAKETRQRHPDTWIVRVNINNFTTILHEIKTNGFDEKGVLKLLTKAAQIKKSDSVQLEKQLFKYIYSSTGNMAVLFDGVDDVGPHYTEEVIQILRILSKTKIRKIWITSRNFMKDQLEQELQCQSYSLRPFSFEDQKIFLLKLWNQKYLNTKEDNLKDLANRVVELSFKHLSDRGKGFMGVPLQGMLLAEMFEEELRKCSTSRTVILPQHINLVMLFDAYVKKKWDVYLAEKKNSDRINSPVPTDDEVLHVLFLDNHKAAALKVILSTHHFEKLNDTNVQTKATDFLQRINHGMEKTGIITDVIDSKPVFQHRLLAEYFVARWLCENFQASQIFMRDHLFESGFSVVRSMVDRILADKYPLHQAVLDSHIRYVAKLLKRKQSIPQKDRGGRTPLHVAVSCRSPQLIRLLLQHGADVSSVDTFLGLSPLEYAIRMVDGEVLSLIMEKRPDIREHVLNEMNHGCTEYNVSALRAAARYGHTDLLRYLIRRENCVNMAVPGVSGTLLREAARGNHIQTVRTLVDLGANCDIQDENGKTALHVSAESGSLEVVKFLLERQEMSYGEAKFEYFTILDRSITKLNRLNVRDKDGNTPLHLAVATGNTSTVRYLLSAGSDLRSCNTRAEYPLTVAAGYGRNDIVKLLLESCCAVKCEEIMTSALTAAIVAGQTDTTALLLTAGAPVSGGENEKPIHVASRIGHKEIVSLLLQYGASLTSRTDSGNTPYHLASEAGHLSLVEYFNELQSDGLYLLNFETETPLHLADRNGRDLLVTYFAENGCNINATSSNDVTCLHLACENGRYTAVEYLLKHGAGVNAVNSAHHTPLHIADSRRQTRLVQLLFQDKAKSSLRDKDDITSFLAAFTRGHQDSIQHGGNIEDSVRNRNSIAHFSVAQANLEVLILLSDKHEILHVLNFYWVTPLLQTVCEERNLIAEYITKEAQRTSLYAAVIELIRLLKKRNVPLSQAGRLFVEAARFGFLDLLQRFVALGDDIKVKADNGESSLHTACECGHVAAIPYPSEHGAVPDSQDNSGNTALHVAVSNGHLIGTRTLVETGANLSNADAGGSTALHIAGNNGYVNNVSLLTESFTPIDMRNGKKETALPVAASQGHEKLGTVLMEHGAGVWVRDIEGKTALDVATDKGYSEVTRLIKDRTEGVKPVRSISHIDLNANPESGKVEYQQRTVNARASADTENDINDTDNAQMLKTVAEAALELHKYPRSALNIAAANNSLEEEQRLVEAGTALDYGDPFRSTALYVASSKDRKSIVQVTLENGSCVDMPYCQGVTPIDIAATEGNLEAVNAIRLYDPAVNHESREYLKELLHEAAESGDPQTVQAVLKRGISVETVDNFGYTPLHVCAKCGHKELSRILLDFGANVNTKDKHGRTPLILSATNGHIDVVRVLLKRGASVHIADEYGLTPLHAAAQEGNVEIVRDLLNHKASVDIKDKYDFTPLYAAARKGHVEVVQRLLNHGASVDIANIDGETPLFIAARYDHVEVIRVLLKHRAKVNHSNNDGETPLYMAARYGHVGVSQQLLNHGATVDFTSERRATPLHIAALYGHEEVIGALLNYAASVDIANDDGWTPLHEAASKGHMEVVRKLLNHGACVDIADSIGRKPLNTAASKGHVEVVRELLNHGASVDATNTDGCTPLNAAAQEGQVEVVRELLNHGANVYIARDKGWTPLNEAALNGHVEVVRELLNHGVGVDFAMSRGRTALYLAAANGRLEVIQELLNNEASVYIVKSNVSISLQAAAEMGHVEIIRELLKYDAAVDVANEDGMTPLNTAARFGHVEVVRELLNHGASVDTANTDGCTPLIAAAQEGHFEIVRELLNHGANVYISRDEGWAPLNEAALNGNVEVVRELLNHVGVDFAIDRDWSALYLAAANGHLEVIRELLHHGASVHTANKDGWTPLNIAARCGHVDVVRELLDHGASVDIANNNVCTPLHAAAETGHAEVVRELLNRGASVDIANKDGWTPLNTAARCVHLDVVRELLNHGASVDIANNEGTTPLITAASDGHVEFVRILLHYGATVDITDKGGFTPLNAASQSGHVAVVEELLNRGANVNICNENGAAPLNAAALNGHVDSVRVLLNHGAEVNIANKDGFSPLYSAVSKGHIEVVRELLNHGAQVDILKEDGWSLFNVAAQRGDLEVIRELLKRALDNNISKLSVWQRVKTIAEKGDMYRVRDLINHIGSKNFAKKSSPK